MNTDQEKLFKTRVDKIPEIKISMDTIVDFLNQYSQAENIDFKKVLDNFETLTDKGKKIVLEYVEIRNRDQNQISKANNIITAKKSTIDQDQRIIQPQNILIQSTSVQQDPAKIDLSAALDDIIREREEIKSNAAYGPDTPLSERTPKINVMRRWLTQFDGTNESKSQIQKGVEHKWTTNQSSVIETRNWVNDYNDKSKSRAEIKYTETDEKKVEKHKDYDTGKREGTNEHG